MKKLLSSLLIVLVMTSGSCMYVNAAHQHTDACYEIQGKHSHTGDTTNGGECYATPVYHSHTGDSTNGGECYATPVYHTHTGDTTNGGECYATPVYHKHTGAAGASANGCYTKQKITQQPITCTDEIKSNPASTKHYNGSCSKCGPTYTTEYVYFWYCPHTKTYASSYSGIMYQCRNCDGVSTSGTTSGTKTHTVYNNVTTYDLGCGKTTETVEKYNLSCTKTAETIESYELSCGMTDTTVVGYELSCTKPESAGTKVLVCKQKETTDTPSTTPSTPSTPSVPTPVPSIPTPTPKPEVVNPAPEVKEPVKEVVKEEPVKDTEENVFDFRVECNLVSDGALVKIIPISEDNLAERPYSWDNGLSWNKSDESIFAKNGTYYIAIKNNEGKVKAKKLDIDLTSTNFAVITDYAATLTEVEFKEIVKEPDTDAEEPATDVMAEVTTDEDKEVKDNKKSGGNVVAAVAAITVFVAALGGGGFFLVKFLLGGGAGGAAKMIDKESGKVLGKCSIKKNGNHFETKINDKALIFAEDGCTITVPEKFANRYIGYDLIVKTSQGDIKAEIAETIEIDF